MRPSSPGWLSKPALHASVGRRSRGSDVALPVDLAFLRAYGVTLPVLQRAAARALLEAVPAFEWLIASGGVSALLFYRALADHLGLPFVQGGVEIADDVAASSAILGGFASLAPNAPAAWLLAPRGHAVRLLLEGRGRGYPMPDALVTTPARLSALVRRADAAAMAKAASEALPSTDPSLCAKNATGPRFLAALVAGLLILGTAVFVAPTLAAVVTGMLFFAAMVFRLLVCAAGLRDRVEPAPMLADADLPFYAVLVPLYREAGMVPRLVERLDRLDYPRSKLEIRLLIEPDDVETQLACLSASLGSHYELLVVPRGDYPTKPRALNVALPLVRGTLVTVFDAEDDPEPQQLRQAAARFRHASPDLACVQASLFIENAGKNLLTRLFSLEYAALFDLFNHGVAGSRLPMALGGTSNHFRTAALRQVGGWDAWNVAEDADLGLRLARFGFRTETVCATTSEEAPMELGNWFRQRRRWTKGWMQTAAVLASHPRRVYADLGVRSSLAVVLHLTSLLAGPLASFPLTLLALAQLGFHGLPACATAMEWAAATLWTSVFMLGPASSFWPALVGLRIRRMRVSPVALFALLPYQLLIGFAAWGGFVDLLVKPYHWHKTRHGAAPSSSELLRRRAPWPRRASRIGRSLKAPAVRLQIFVRALRAA